MAAKYIHSFLLSDAPNTTDTFPENLVVMVLCYHLALGCVACSSCKCNCLRTIGPMTVSHSKIMILQQHVTRLQYCCVLQLFNFVQCYRCKPGSHFCDLKCSDTVANKHQQMLSYITRSPFLLRHYITPTLLVWFDFLNFISGDSFY